MTKINLDNIRKDIDSIDSKLAQLFKERMENLWKWLATKRKQLGCFKTTRREKEILHKVSEEVGEPFDGYARLVFNTIFDVSRSCQNNYLARKSDLAERIQQALEETPKIFLKKQLSPVRVLPDLTLRLPAKSFLKFQA